MEMDGQDVRSEPLEDGGPVSGDRLTESDAVSHRLVLGDSSFAKRFLRSSRASGRTSCPSASMMS
jgi:hypothetical protein